MRNWLKWLWRKLFKRKCDHRYRKHWSRIAGGYVMRCVRCNEAVPRL